MSLGVDARLRALAHPVRLQIMSLLTGAALTAADVARELGMNHSNASYHLRQLLAVGAIEVVGEERIRGGIAKRYRYVVEKKHRTPEPDDAATPGDGHRLMFEAVATELRRRAGHIRRIRGNHMTDAEIWVDAESWQQFRDAVAEASTALHVAARPPRTEGTIRVSATIALFEMTPSDVDTSGGEQA